MNDKHFFKLAKKESKNANYSGYSKVKLGCVVAYHNTVLSVGHNENRSHTVQAKYNIYRYDDSKLSHYFNASIHAEIQALNKIKYLDIDFSKIELYVYRETADGEVALARPCESCMALIREMGIKTIHYTGNKSFITEKLI